MKKFILLIIEKIRKSFKVDENGNSFGWRKGTLLLVTLMMIGCDYQNPDGSYDTSKSLNMGTVVIDNCEYIDAYNRLSHKGNCRFCEKRDSIKWEKRKKELKELIKQLKGK